MSDVELQALTAIVNASAVHYQAELAWATYAQAAPRYPFVCPEMDTLSVELIRRGVTK